MPLDRRTFVLPFLIFLITFALEVNAVDLLTLPNGMQFIFDIRPGSNVVAIQFWMRVGSKYEEDRKAGITHFIEHLIFKGSKKLEPNEIAQRIESLGGTLNAFTSYDDTVYHVVIPKESFHEGFLLLHEAIFNPTFPEEEIEKERKVVLEEIKMKEDDPWRKLYNELFMLSYANHPYGRPIIGFPETVNNLTREDILAYFNDHYIPERTVIVIVGDFNLTLAKDLAHNIFGKLERKGKNEEKKRNTSGKRGTTKVIHKDVLESYMAISYPIPSLVNEDIPTLEVLSALLTEGESSRIQNELKNKEMILTGASSFVFAPEEEGLFVIQTNFRGTDFENILKKVEDELKRLGESLSEWELVKAKNQIKASYIYGSETVQGRARLLGHYYTITKDLSFVDKFLEKVDKVGPDDLKRVIKQYFSEEKRNVVVILPQTQKKRSNPVYGELENGLKYVINRNQSAPLFSFSIGFVGGVKNEPHGKNGLFNLLSRMLLKGTKKKDGLRIAILIDTLAGQINPFCGYNLFGLSGKFMSKDFIEILSLLQEILMEAEFTEQELNNVKNEVLSELRQKEDDPVSYLFRKFNAFFYEGHPYEKDPSGTPEDVLSITIEDLKRAYTQFVSPKNCVFAISGDIEIKETQRLLRELFSKWDGPRSDLIRENVQERKGEKFFEKDLVQNHIIFGFPSVSLTEKERFPLEVIDALFSGMGGRVHKMLREENPFAYATTFFNHMGYDTGTMGIYAAFDPKVLKDVKETIKREIAKILEEGFSEEEVERAKRYLVGNYLISIQSNTSIAYRMMVDTFYGLGPDFFKKWPENIRSVKKEEVEKAAKKYLKPEKAITVILGKKF
ncbi:MAG: insulinase family protein [Deltaproteobacteria bacterium]|nr:insulinase family protein [Deltaproteobacteria bacterium]